MSKAYQIASEEVIGQSFGSGAPRDPPLTQLGRA